MTACRCGCRREPARWYQGFTVSCYQRWIRAGRPEEFGPPRWTWAGGERNARIGEYSELRSWGLSRAEAAVRLGLCRRTIERYESTLRSRTPASQHRGEVA